MNVTGKDSIPLGASPSQRNTSADLSSSDDSRTGPATAVEDGRLRRFPCKARGLRGKNHTDKTAYLEVAPYTEHGAVLRCSNPVCSASGRAFRWCAVCVRPVAKRNFMKRHSHGLVTTLPHSRRSYVRDQTRPTQEENVWSNESNELSTTNHTSTEDEDNLIVDPNQQTQPETPTTPLLDTDSHYCKPTDASQADNDLLVVTGSTGTGVPKQSTGSTLTATVRQDTNGDGSYSPSPHLGPPPPPFLMNPDMAEARAMLMGPYTSVAAAALPPSLPSSAASSMVACSYQAQPTSCYGYNVDWPGMPSHEASGGTDNWSRRSSSSFRSISPVGEPAPPGQEIQQDMLDDFDLDPLLD